MSYIYKITNDINNKIYIGKTNFSIERRFKEHCKEAKKLRAKNRPLYNAMNKYGIEHFHIEVIEETNFPEERERYWIEYYGSFKYGYNATLGGDGKNYLDYDLIFSLYKEGKTITEIAKLLKSDPGHCSKILEQYGITKEEKQYRKRQAIQKTIIQLDKETEEIIEIYPSIIEAYKTLGKQHSGHIAEVCNGKRNSAYGYKWKYG